MALIKNNIIPHKSVVLLITTLGSFLTPFMGSALNIALPVIGTEFQMTAIGISWIATAYMLAAAMFLVPFGQLADIYGRKKIYLVGIALYTVSSCLCTLANSGVTLIIFRILQGIGGAMVFATAVAILTSVYPVQERGKVLGINVAVVYFGLSVGPFLGGILTQHFGWRSIFLINVLLGIFILLITLWKLTGDWKETDERKFDIIGSIIYGIMLIAFMYGLTRLPSLSGGGFILIAGVGLLTFIVWEKKTASPLVELSILQNNRVFVFSNLAALINYSATAAVSFLLSLYLQYIKGLSPQYSGVVLIFQPMVQAIFSPVAGRISDSIEPRIVASFGMALSAIGLALLILINTTTPIWYSIFNLMLLGFGFALFSSPNTNAVMSSVEKRFYGVASATMATMRLLGMTISMGIITLIFSIYIGRAKLSPENYPLLLTSIRIAFIIFTILCGFGILASLTRGKIH
ncbi:MAG: MFS transporter [bacterium]|nr:MFS transporter [bacterium]